ncbi:hypothetical protein IWW38_002446 [Coemansia aciculifera]|uniref:Uncharacterized protein n=1 Tax=Coemansia aciculifera TaxID=417176 RepID=A0ACC1M3X1_9FUNG|nr:hypothetical protein IWW38_002446 [Coemansia aciculifera]
MSVASQHHPYFPQSLELSGYTPPTQTPLTLVLVMGSGLGAVLVGTYALFSRQRICGAALGLLDRLAATWFVLCGALHCVYELYYLLHFRTLASAEDVLASTWKEYAKSDSRYLAQVPLVFALETITVTVTGPLCLVAAHAIWNQSLGQRHIAQLSASVLHLYSVALYFGTELIAAESGCRPEPLYYYGYFIAMNAPWVVVPLALAIQSTGAICHAMQVAKSQ